MKTIQFAKCESLLNDFCVIHSSSASARWTASRIRELCDRRRGIGADGLIILRSTAVSRYAFRLFNADGSSAEWSGNGIRCAAAYVAKKTRTTTATFLTAVGAINTRIKRSASGVVSVSYDRPLPTATRQRWRAKRATGFKPSNPYIVDAGNPHWVFLVSHFDFDWEQVGEQCQLETRSTHGVNVEFAKVDSSRRVTLRLFERGVGPTPSSGSGALAAFAACVHGNHVSRSITAASPGGVQRLRYHRDNEQVEMTANARLVYSGEYRIA